MWVMTIPLGCGRFVQVCGKININSLYSQIDINSPIPSPSPMIYCLYPDCQNPQNPDHYQFCQTCGTKLIPLLLNRFRILKPLGQGGFGKTYQATDEHRMKSNCVIKQFAPSPQMQQQMQISPQLRDKML